MSALLRTYYNPHPEGSPKAREHWINYQNHTALAQYHADAVGGFLERNHQDKVANFQRACREINGTFSSGLHEVTLKLKGLGSEQHRTNELLSFANGNLQLVARNSQRVIDELDSINQRLELIQTQAKITNDLLARIGDLLRIPESQKQRQHHIEMGLKFLHGASRDTDLLSDALREFRAAAKLLETDHFTLYHIGLLHLYAPTLIDLEEAAQNLRKAVKYASIELGLSNDHLETVPSGILTTRLCTQPPASHGKLRHFTAECYRHLAAAEYALANKGRARAAMTKAYGTLSDQGHSSNDGYRLLLAKYLASDGEVDAALGVLKDITLLGSISVRDVANDLDLAAETFSRWDWSSNLRSAFQKVCNSIEKNYCIESAKCVVADPPSDHEEAAIPAIDAGASALAAAKRTADATRAICKEKIGELRKAERELTTNEWSFEILIGVSVISTVLFGIGAGLLYFFLDRIDNYPIEGGPFIYGLNMTIIWIIGSIPILLAFEGWRWSYIEETGKRQARTRVTQLSREVRELEAARDDSINREITAEQTALQAFDKWKAAFATSAGAIADVYPCESRSHDVFEECLRLHRQEFPAFIEQDRHLLTRDAVELFAASKRDQIRAAALVFSRKPEFFKRRIKIGRKGPVAHFDELAIRLQGAGRLDLG